MSLMFMSDDNSGYKKRYRKYFLIYFFFLLFLQNWITPNCHSQRSNRRRRSGSLAQPSPTTKSSSWRRGSSTRSTCRQRTGTRSRPLWDCQTHRWASEKLIFIRMWEVSWSLRVDIPWISIFLFFFYSCLQVITWFQNRRAKLKRDMEELRKDVEITSSVVPSMHQMAAAAGHQQMAAAAAVAALASRNLSGGGGAGAKPPMGSMAHHHHILAAHAQMQQQAAQMQAQASPPGSSRGSIMSPRSPMGRVSEPGSPQIRVTDSDGWAKKKISWRWKSYLRRRRITWYILVSPWLMNGSLTHIFSISLLFFV